MSDSRHRVRRRLEGDGAIVASLVGSASRRSRRLLGLLVAATGSLSASCSDSSPPLPPPPEVLNVTMSEYRFEFDRVQFIPSGRLVVNANNVGTLQHEIVMLKLDEDSPPIGEIFSRPRTDSTPGRPALTVAQILRDPGRDGSIALELGPGRYAFVCFIHDDDGVHHGRKGMSTELRIT